MSQIAVCYRQIRPQLQHLLERNDRLIELIPVAQSIAQTEPRLDMVRCELEGTPETGNCFFGCALQMQCFAEVVPQQWILRFQFRGAPVILYRFCEPAQFLERIPPILARCGRVGFDLDYPPV